MSRTKKDQRGGHHGHPGKEYWKSRLHSGGEILGPITKRLTHRKERREAREEIRRMHTCTFPELTYGELWK